MLKYAGICLLSVCMALYGVIKAHEIKKSIALRKNILELLYHIENSIAYSGKSKDRIFKSFSPVPRALQSFLTEIAITNNVSQCVNNHFSILCKNDRQMLTGFFMALGKSTRCENESKNCRQFISEFEKSGQNTEKEQLDKITLYRKLGIIFALITAVIFL